MAGCDVDRTFVSALPQRLDNSRGVDSSRPSRSNVMRRASTAGEAGVWNVSTGCCLCLRRIPYCANASNVYKGVIHKSYRATEPIHASMCEFDVRFGGS